MTTMTAEAFAVLHALCVKGMAGADPVARMAGLTPDAAESRLREAEVAGAASFLAARKVWRVTPQGRSAHAGRLGVDLTLAETGRLDVCYRKFLPLNTALKELCTRWQLRGGEPNDHGDAGYDDAIRKELREAHARLLPLAEQLAEIKERYGRYADRLTEAFGRFQDGDDKAFTGVLCDSYHDVWMELHRDLLLSLGIDRRTEDPS